MVATLTRVFGPERLELAEDVVQEALVRALRLWPFEGVPENPAAWLTRTARNLALDLVRRDASFRAKEPELRASLGARRGRSDAGSDEVRDDQLRLIFTCCHEALPREARVALTLKTLCGFGVGEIARAFLTAEAAIEQRLVRAKRKLREEGVRFEVPAGAALRRRLEAVLEVVYLMFNEGTAAHRGEDLVRHDLVAEALRLAGLLVAERETRTPAAEALCALVHLQAARLPARVDAGGDLILLEDQDRSLWDRELIQRGFQHLKRAMRGSALTTWHLEAGIASCHALAPRFEATDWPRILGFYDALLELNPSPVVALNRAVALAMVDGPEAGLAAVGEVADDPALERYFLLPAVRGELLRRAGRPAAARAAFAEALRLAGTEPERRFLRRRMVLSTPFRPPRPERRT
jgi:RNA polymerase sigma-70 factor (ECF subfamily)